MAYVSTSSLGGARVSTSALVQGLTGWLVRVGERHSRHDQIEALQRLSDTELAARGLTREGIVAHVFRDRMGL